jgi:LAO/AO transport system kinase
MIRFLNLLILKKKAGRFEEVSIQQAEKRFEYWVQEYILSLMKKSNS